MASLCPLLSVFQPSHVNPDGRRARPRRSGGIKNGERLNQPLPAWSRVRDPDGSGASVAPAAETAGPRRVRLRLGFVDLEGPALEVLAVQHGDGLGGLFTAGHLDEAEAPRFAAELGLDDGRLVDLAVRREGVSEVVLADGVGRMA